VNDQKLTSGDGLTRLEIKVEGPKVGQARLSAGDFAEIVRRTQQALKRIGQVLYGQQSNVQGRKPKDIEQQCELFMVEWRPGSAIAALELAAPPAQQNLFGFVGEESLKAFLDGMEKVAEGKAQPLSLPVGFDVGVLQTCDAIGSVLQHGIQHVRFSANGRISKTTLYDEGVRNGFRALLGQPSVVGQITKAGRLEELNGHGALTGRLYEADGTRWLCRFKVEQRDLLPEAWLHTVKLTGKAITEETRENVFEVESILVLDDLPAETVAVQQTTPFWKPLSLDELAQQQGVSPVNDLDEISALWPADDDPDELLNHIITQRNERRALHQGHPGTE
jgi:hypothetical protein